MAEVLGAGRRRTWVANSHTSRPSSCVPATWRSSASASAGDIWMPVGVGRGEHVVDLGDGEDARRHRDASAGEAVRVALAVDALVVGEHGRGDLAHALDAQQQPGAVGGMALDQPPLGGMQLAAADQDVVGERLLAEVVQQAGGVDDRLLALGQPGGAGQLVRVVGDRGGVAGGAGSRSASVSSSRPSMPSWRTSS